MAFGNKQFFLIIETQVTIDGAVADFGAIVCDKVGRIYAECAVLVADEFGVKSLFYDEKATGVWSLEGRNGRQQHYKEMLKTGNRMLVSTTALNRWLERVFTKYAPCLTAFNLTCELDGLKKTEIDVSKFTRRFSLRDAAKAHFAQSKKYKAFIEDKSQEDELHTMASFATGVMLPPVSNTALEDVKSFALPILTAIVKLKNWREIVKNSGGVGFSEQDSEKIANMAGTSKPTRQISPKREAVSKNTSPARLVELAEMPDESVQRAVAKNQHALPETLEKLGSSSDYKTRMAVAANPSSSASLLEKLAGDKDYGGLVVNRIASNPNTPVALLEKLAVGMDKRSMFFRRNVANNPNTPATLLGKLAEDRFVYVRVAVARNPNTPATALEKLAKDAENIWVMRNRLCVKEMVAANPNTPAEVLKILAGDNDCEVRATVAENPNTPLSVREKLIEDGDIFGYAEELAKRRNTPVTLRKKALEQLADSKYPSDRVTAAKNRNTPVAMLVKLLEDKDISVRVAAAENPSTPAELLVNPFHAIAKNPDTPIATLESLAVDVDSEIRRYVADNPSTPAPVLEKLAKDEHEIVRWDVASNPNTPTLTLEILANDAIARVRKTACDALRHRKSISSNK